MKSKEELNVLKEEVETLNKKLHELTEEELTQIFGGTWDGDWNNWEPQPGITCFECRKGTLVEDPTSDRPKCVCDNCGTTWYWGSGLNWSWFAAFIGGMMVNH